jgi:hypothetical protein
MTKVTVASGDCAGKTGVVSTSISRRLNILHRVVGGESPRDLSV